MPKHRRLKHMEDPNDASGKDPEYGAIFMSNKSTAKECLKRNLFGLPIGQARFVKQVKDGMMLFLFEFESRELHGVFQACSDGAINIEPDAFRSSGKQFPAQVKFIEKWHCRPLCENEFRHAIRDNYFTAKKFNFGLSKDQVQRLSKLFSLNKVERSLLRETAASKSTRKCNLGNTDGDRGFRNRYAGETNRDIDREIPVRVTYEGDLRGRRLSRGIEYSGDTSDVYRRLVDSKMHGLKDRVGYNFNMSNSFGTDALTNESDYSPANDRKVSNNVRHTASRRLENENYEKDGIRQATSWSNDKERLNFEAGSVVPAQSLVRQDLPHEANRGYYDHCDPGIMGDAAMKSFRCNLVAPNVDLMGLPSLAVNSNIGLREEIMSDGGYVSEAFRSETLQAFPDEHNGISITTTSSPGEEYYIPMPIEYHTNSRVIGSESESRNGHLHYSQYPGLLTAAWDTKNIRKFETLSHSGHTIYPSFAYPSSPRNLSPNCKIKNEIPAYQRQEDFGGHVSNSNDIYPFFTYHSTSAGGVDLYPENRTQNEGQAYQQDEKLSRDDINSSNRVLQMTDDVRPAELKRKSVFSRLAMPSKECDAEMETSPDSESVNEVMSYLDNRHKHWMEQKRPNIRNSEGSGIPKKKKEKFHTAEVLDNELALPFTETTPNDVLDCEESMEDFAQKLTFIDFKRRRESQKSSGNSTQGCTDIPNHSAPQNKKRKLLRPKLILDDSQKDKGIDDGPIENIFASQAVNEVPVNDFRGRNEDDPEKNMENNDDPLKKVLASHSATEVPIIVCCGYDEDDSEKNLTNNGDPVRKVLASQSATEIPVHDFRGGDEDDSEKNIRNDDGPTINVLASHSATEVPILDLRVRDEDDSEKNLTNNEYPVKNVLASQSATEVLFRGCDEDDSEKNIRNNNDPIKLVLASQLATEVPFHDFLGRNEDDPEKGRGNNDGPIENVMASQSATEVPFHDFFVADRR